MSKSSGDRYEEASITLIPKERALSHTFDEFKNEHFTQLSRRIQLEIRDQEMMELADEAERAAEAGQERFVGSATVFGLGLDYDPSKANGYREDSFTDKDSEVNSSRRIMMTDETVKSHSLHDLILMNSETNAHLSTPVSTVERLSQSIQSSSSKFLPMVGREFLPRVRVMNLRPIDEVFPVFKDMHGFVGQNLIQMGADLGTNPQLHEGPCHCKDDCMFPCRHQSHDSFVENYFYTRERDPLVSQSSDLTQPPEIMCGRDFCQESSCAQIGCFMIDSTIKSFFYDLDTTRKTAIIFNNAQDNPCVTVGGLTYRLPRHQSETHSQSWLKDIQRRGI